jgi:signal transduction histidine kinase
VHDPKSTFPGDSEVERRVVERTSALEASNTQLAREVEERRTAEQQIKALFRRLILAQEEERRRIARDIHDQIGQQMTALRMSLSALRTKAAGLAIEELVARAERLAEELDDSVDLLTIELRPAVLDHFGLTAALENLVSRWTEQSGIEATLDVRGRDAGRLPYDVEFHLYRLVQEALQNVAKHAAATKVRVMLQRDSGRVALTIGDNGRGFDPQALDDSGGGLGLLAMRERATLAGGDFDVQTGRGKGTTIRVRVPVGGPGRARAER